jgi:hypothetical protein
VDDDFASDPGEIDETPPEGFLYQAGYLTLRYKDDMEFVLDYPNREIRSSLSTLFLENLSSGTAWLDIRHYGRDLTRHLSSGDVKGMVGVFARLLSTIIYYDHADANREPRVMPAGDGVQETAGEGSPKETSRVMPGVLAEKMLRTMGEGFFRSILHAGLWMAGALVTAVKGENIGRSDLEAVYGRYPYIIELKMTEDVTGADKAVKAGMLQIDERGYGRSYWEPIFGVIGRWQEGAEHRGLPLQNGRVRVRDRGGDQTARQAVARDPVARDPPARMPPHRARGRAESSRPLRRPGAAPSRAGSFARCYRGGHHNCTGAQNGFQEPWHYLKTRVSVALHPCQRPPPVHDQGPPTGHPTRSA